MNVFFSHHRTNIAVKGCLSHFNQIKNSCTNTMLINSMWFTERKKRDNKKKENVKNLLITYRILSFLFIEMWKERKKAPKPYFGYSEFVALRMGVFLLVLWLFATDILRTAMCYVMSYLPKMKYPKIRLWFFFGWMFSLELCHVNNKNNSVECIIIRETFHCMLNDSFLFKSQASGFLCLLY